MTEPDIRDVLTTSAIWSAMRERQLVVSPLLFHDQVGPAAIDLRLGTQVLTMKQTHEPVIDPSGLDFRKTRAIQRLVNLAIGEKFTLHPGQFVLGATFEYIALSPALCAMVLSRSRFGRAGLIVATASFVHPGWRGCLTLELFNAGVLPLTLDCGSPVAQLTVWRARPDLDDVPRAPIPTGPRFAIMSHMKDWKRLREFHTIWEQQGWGLTNHNTT